MRRRRKKETSEKEEQEEGERGGSCSLSVSSLMFVVSARSDKLKFNPTMCTPHLTPNAA